MIRRHKSVHYTCSANRTRDQARLIAMRLTWKAAKETKSSEKFPMNTLAELLYWCVMLLRTALLGGGVSVNFNIGVIGGVPVNFQYWGRAGIFGVFYLLLVPYI